MPGTRSRGAARAPTVSRGAQRGGRSKRVAEAVDAFAPLPGTRQLRQPADKQAEDKEDKEDKEDEDAANEPHLGRPQARPAVAQRGRSAGAAEISTPQLPAAVPIAVQKSVPQPAQVAEDGESDMEDDGNMPSLGLPPLATVLSGHGHG